MKVASGMLGKGFPKMTHEFCRKVANHGPRERSVYRAMHPSGQVDNTTYEGLVHRHVGMPIALDIGFVCERLRKRLTQTDSNIFDRMVIIDMQVPVGLHGEIKPSVAREQVEHVVKKTDARLMVIRPRAIETKSDGNVRFFGISLNGRVAGRPILVRHCSFSYPLGLLGKSNVNGALQNYVLDRARHLNSPYG